jgi:tRNA dimethylallyltransferase
MKAVLLMGPTASGKTQLALELAKILPIEIISVDSALIYKDMDIGTAKPTKKEQHQVPHHLIDILSPLDSYSVFNFLQDVGQLIEQISKRGNTALLVGGTMMYYNAILHGISRLPASDESIRQQLQERVKLNGLNELYFELEKVDKLSANKININDSQRIIRALEVYYISGKALSQLQIENLYNPLQNIQFLSLSLIPQRDILHKRIENRCDKMFADGFIDEVLLLKNKYQDLTKHHTSMRCVGYYQVWEYLENLYSLAELNFRAKAVTRQLAKRQITWLRSIDNYNLLIDEDFIVMDLINKTVALINDFLK